MMYIDDNHINITKMGPRQMKPEWPCEIRKLSYTGSNPTNDSKNSAM